MGVCGVLGSPLSLHGVRWEFTLIRGCPLLLLILARWVPFLLLGHAMLWEYTLPYRGVPPFLGAWPARCMCARSVPCSLLPSRCVLPLLL